MSDKSTSKGVGFMGLLQLAFIILKLRKIIEWSWWWVLSPVLIVLAIVVMLFVLAILFAGFNDGE